MQHMYVILYGVICCILTPHITELLHSCWDSCWSQELQTPSQIIMFTVTSALPHFICSHNWNADSSCSEQSTLKSPAQEGELVSKSSHSVLFWKDRFCHYRYPADVLILNMVKNTSGVRRRNTEEMQLLCIINEMMPQDFWSLRNHVRIGSKQ